MIDYQLYRSGGLSRMHRTVEYQSDNSQRNATIRKLAFIVHNFFTPFRFELALSNSRTRDYERSRLRSRRDFNRERARASLASTESFVSLDRLVASLSPPSPFPPPPARKKKRGKKDCTRERPLTFRRKRRRLSALIEVERSSSPAQPPVARKSSFS